MSPNDAAELLGVSPAATRDEVERAYQARLAEAGADPQRRDALTAARDALVAASAWQPPFPQNAQTQPYPPQNAPTQPYPPQNAPTQPYPPQNAQPQPPFTPQAPFTPPPGQPQQGYTPPRYGPGAPGAYQGYPQPPRRRMSTGAIVGITVGGILGGLAILLVAVIVIASIGASASRIARAESSSSASPYPGDPGDGSSDDPSDQPSPEPSDPGSKESGVDDYDVDGVHIHYIDGWSFELTPGQTCAGATVTATFADTPEGETLDSWSTTVDLEAGVPYELTIPDNASEYDYAGIESVECGQA